MKTAEQWIEEWVEEWTKEMKTPEQLLKEKRITPETKHHNYDYVYRAVCKIIEQAQKDAYNQALEDAAKSAVAYDTVPRVYSSCVVDKQSILKLKK